MRLCFPLLPKNRIITNTFLLLLCCLRYKWRNLGLYRKVASQQASCSWSCPWRRSWSLLGKSWPRYRGVWVKAMNYLQFQSIVARRNIYIKERPRKDWRALINSQKRFAIRHEWPNSRHGIPRMSKTLSLSLSLSLSLCIVAVAVCNPISTHRKPLPEKENPLFGGRES